MQTPSYVWAYLKKRLPEETVSQLKRMTMLKDGTGAVFDVPTSLSEEFLKQGTSTGASRVSVPLRALCLYVFAGSQPAAFRLCCARNPVQRFAFLLVPPLDRSPSRPRRSCLTWW